MEEIETLKSRLRQLDEEIREAERRLPAHSTKPPTMMLLLELEDERERIAARVAALKTATPGDKGKTDPDRSKR
jgi:hypothetical protein